MCNRENTFVAMTVGELEFYLSLIKDKSLHVVVSSTEEVDGVTADNDVVWLDIEDREYLKENNYFNQ